MAIGKITKNIPVGSPYNPANSDIGNYSNYNVNDWKVDFDTSTTTEIGNVLGTSSRNVGVLCTHPNINMNALFRPNKTAPYNMGDFLGYNHSANPTTYFFNTPVNGTYPINYNSVAKTYSVGFGYVLKKGERPPVSPRNWNYARLKFVISGDASLAGTYYSSVQAVTDNYDNIILSLPLTSGANRNITIQITGEYSNSSNQYVANIEDNIYTINALLSYTITYTTAPSLLVNNTVSPTFKHYYTQRVGTTSPTITTVSEFGISGDLRISNTNSTPINGLIRNIPDDISEINYAKTYNYSVILFNNRYYRVNLKTFNRSVNYTYQLNTTDPYQNWYKVNSIENGYNFYMVNSTSDVIDLNVSVWP